MSKAYENAFTDLYSTISFGGGGKSSSKSGRPKPRSAKGLPPSSPILSGPKSVPGTQTPLERWQDSTGEGFGTGRTGGGGGVTGGGGGSPLKEYKEDEFIVS